MSDNGQITWTNEKRRLGDLIPWEDNPRQITKEQAERLERSISKFGYSQPIEIEPDGTVIDGHQRKPVMLLLKEFGSNAEIDVRVASRKMILEERKEYMALKHEGATGEWDWDGMHNLYTGDELVDFGFDIDKLEMHGFEFDTDEPEDDPGAQIDRAEELREKWGVESGQLWLLGEHRLICGDCTDAEVVSRLMQGEKAGAVVTDPPYGIGYIEWSLLTDGEEPIMSDGRDIDIGEFYHQQARIWWDIVNPGAVLYTFYSPSKPECRQSIERVGWEIKDTIVWIKPSFAPGRNDYQNQWESILYGYRPDGKRFWCGRRDLSNVWEIGRDKGVLHPTNKPIELIENICLNSTQKNTVVFDPFLGSGTTLIACERLGRKCRAVEISPAYCAVAIQRWVDMTGGEPELVSE